VIEGSKPKLLDGDQFTEWLQSYVKNYGTTGARIDYAKLAEQYKIESE
jgi:hypothetical protein